MQNIIRRLSVAIGLLGCLGSTPAKAEWDEWRPILYPKLAEPGLVTARQIGITGVKVLGTRTDSGPTANQAAAEMAPLLAAGMRPYIENIATDFYAPYHRYVPDQPITWLYDEIKRRYHADANDPSVRMREPGLSDRQWIARIEARLASHVRIYGKYKPLYYSLGDETGIADLAANWDFDLSPTSLQAMHKWLRPQYPSLAALNGQWGTWFTEWANVVPPTTQATIERTDGNYSAWSDGRAWMDEAFAEAVRRGTRALHRADALALSSIEGAQTPGWGGYDYTRLAGAVDVLEAYNYHNNIEIAKSLNPKLVLLTTAFKTGPIEFHRIWRELLLGGGGIVLWDEEHGFAADDGTLGARGREMTPLFQELTGGIGAQFLASQPARDKVAILYSPVSFRLSWLVDRQADGRDWTLRDSEAENAESPFRAVTRRASSLLHHAGVQPQWLGPDLVSSGELERRGIRVLVLPHVLALSDGEVAAIRRFVARGGSVLADVPPGGFDGHGRKRAALPQIGRVTVLTALSRDDGDPAAFDAAVKVGGGAAAFTLTTPGGAPVRNVDIRVFDNGGVTIVGLLRDFAPEPVTQEVVLRLQQPMWRTDLRRNGDVAQGDTIHLNLGPDSPAVLALSQQRLPAPTVTGSHTMQANTVLSLGLNSASPAAQPVLHVTVTDPSGQKVTRLGGSYRLKQGKVNWSMPQAMAQTPGRWTITVRDGLGGGELFWPVDTAAQ
jgi:hypothetical protein